MALAAALDQALRTDDVGVVRVGGTRVTLRSVVVAFQHGAAAEEISLQYPVLDLTDIYATITYYLRNKTAVDEMLAIEDRESEALTQELERRFSTAELRKRLLARAASR